MVHFTRFLLLKILILLLIMNYTNLISLLRKPIKMNYFWFIVYSFVILCLFVFVAHARQHIILKNS
jgi:hypothetical protein